MRAGFYFVVFAVLPGLAYQFVQDNLREVSRGPLFDYALGITPNALGGVSLTAALIVIGRGGEFVPRWVSDAHLAALALLGLWAWEAAQIWLPNGTFDPHDIAWTVPGVALAYGAAKVILPKQGREAAS